MLAALLRYHGSGALVLGLPPGGVVLAGEVARALRLPLDVLVVREIVIRPYPALIAGALSEGGGLCLNRAVFRVPGASLNASWHEARRSARDILAVIAALRRMHAAHCIVATPFATPAPIQRVARRADVVLALTSSHGD